LYVANALPRFHKWLQFIDTLSWLKRRVLNGISDMQEMIKGLGFDLPLVEAWQEDISPFISVTIPNKLTNVVKYYSYGREREHFLEKIGARGVSKNLIAYYLQSDKPLAIWYAPACDEVNGSPITPTVRIIYEGHVAAHNLARKLHNLTVFEALRLQVAYGESVSCLLHHQYNGGCCGNAGLMWSIYEAGRKAIKELDWQPRWWVEPECRKPDNSG
jgi:hypothetical protein